MTYPYSNINRSHYDSTEEQQSKEITAHKIHLTAIFEYITQQALRYLGFYQVGKGASRLVRNKQKRSVFSFLTKSHTY